MHTYAATDTRMVVPWYSCTTRLAPPCQFCVHLCERADRVYRYTRFDWYPNFGHCLTLCTAIFVVVRSYVTFYYGAAKTVLLLRIDVNQS